MVLCSQKSAGRFQLPINLVWFEMIGVMFFVFYSVSTKVLYFKLIFVYIHAYVFMPEYQVVD